MIQTSFICNYCFQFFCAQCAHMHQVDFILINNIKTTIAVTKMTFYSYIVYINHQIS